MKTKNMKYSLLLLLIPFLAFAGGKGEKVEKIISRQFNIQTDGVLVIENKYGSIDITTGQSNQIKIDVTITSEASDKKKAQETLDRIDVKFEESQNRVSAITEVKSKSGIKSWFSNGDMNIEINYKVVVPVDIYLELVNKYGSIYVETTNRNLKVDLAYGDIRLGDVEADLNLDMAYSEGSISNIKNGKIKLGYSDLEMEDAQSVEIKLQYADLSLGSANWAKIDASFSDFEVGSLGDFIYTGKYVDASIESVKSIEAKSSFSDMEIDGLFEKGNVTMTYGDLEINNIAAGFEQININTSYTDVSLEFNQNTSFTIDAQTSYSDINHKGLKVIEHIEKGTTGKLKASRGTGGGMVIVKMTYGELEIN